MPEQRDDEHHGDGVRTQRVGSAAERAGLHSQRAGGCLYAGGCLPAARSRAFGFSAVGRDHRARRHVYAAERSGRHQHSGGDPDRPLAPSADRADDHGLHQHQLFHAHAPEPDRRRHSQVCDCNRSADSVECVLRKVGIADTEFTDPTGTGRINIFTGTNSPGANVGSSTQSESTLMANQAELNQYDVLMLPCQGGQYTQPPQQLANLVTFANSGGRVYSSHFSYVWMYQNPPFNTVVSWNVQQAQLPDGIATVDQTFSGGVTLAEWLQIVGASTTPGQIAISTLRHDLNDVNPPTQSWLRLGTGAAGSTGPVQQFVFNTPVAATNQCGRVLFNEYHVENPTISAVNKTFPAECAAGTAMTPQEKLLEYMLFELTADGAAATLTPVKQDFGSQPIGFPSNQQTFTWTNNSTFAEGVDLINANGDFIVTSSNCTSVAPGASCSINVVFKPTALGARTGTLSVGSSGTTLTSALTGTGTPDLVISYVSASFGTLDVGARTTQSFTLTNNAAGPVALPPFVTTGDYTVASNCGATVQALSTCGVSITFSPTVYGPRPGTLAVTSSDPAYAGVPTNLTGQGIDFSLALNTVTGDIIAGHGTQFTATTTPLGGFENPVSMTCSTTAPGTTCTIAGPNFTPNAPVQSQVTITSTSKYTVIGYGGFGGWLWVVALGSGGLLWVTRRRLGVAGRGILMVIVMVAGSMSLTGCSGQQPAQNAVYTAPGTYTFTVTATDGFLVRSQTYSLKVTVN